VPRRGEDLSAVGLKHKEWYMMRRLGLTGIETLPMLGLVLAMFVWGSSFLALKIAFRGYDPMVAIWLRMVTATGLFACGWKSLKNVVYTRGDWKFLIFMALCEPCMYFIFEAYALTLTSASQAGMITGILPLIVALMARFFLGEVVSGMTLIGFFLAIAGVTWLSLGGVAAPGAPRPVLGNFLELMAMCWGAGYTICLKKMSCRYPPLFLTAVQSVIGSVFFLFPVLLVPSVHLPHTFDPLATLAIVYLGTVVTLGGYGLYNYGVSKLPASRATAFTNLVPVFALILGWLVLGETLTVVQCWGALLVMAGVVVSQHFGQKKKNGLQSGS